MMPSSPTTLADIIAEYIEDKFDARQHISLLEELKELEDRISFIERSAGRRALSMGAKMRTLSLVRGVSETSAYKRYKPNAIYIRERAQQRIANARVTLELPGTSIKEAAAALRIHEITLRNRIKAGDSRYRVEYSTPRKRTFIRILNLDELLAGDGE